MSATVKRNRERRRGSTLIELAFALMVLLALTLGVAEYGFAFFVKHNLQAAAREGARAGIVPGATAQQVTDAVTVMMKTARLDQTGFTVVVTDSAGKPVDVSKVAAGTLIRVEVRCSWESVGVHALPTGWGGIDPKKVMWAATAMRKEG